jgi:glycosyltransferase involved in cell wall biosynthesis
LEQQSDSDNSLRTGLVLKGSARPKISICIPTHNGAATIAATIQSVLVQKFCDFEILIVDDCSTDETARIVSKFSDSRLRYVLNESSLGVVGNWNRCLDLARGHYYKLLPHDDVLDPQCLSEQVAIFEGDSFGKIALVFGWRRVIDGKGRPLMRRGIVTDSPHLIPAKELIRRCVRAGTNLVGEPGNGLIRLALARRLGLYEHRFPYLIDLDFWFRALQHGDAFHTGSCGSGFRISKAAWSYSIGKEQVADFSGFLRESEAVRDAGLTPNDRLIGKVRANLNMNLRLLLYRLIG